VLRGAGLLLLGLLHALLEIVDLVGLEDLDLEVLQNGEDVVDFLLVLDRLGQGLVDVVEGQVALFLGMPDQLADLLVDAGVAGREIAARSDFGGLFQGGLDGFGLGFGIGGLGFTRHGEILGGSPQAVAGRRSGWRS